MVDLKLNTFLITLNINSQKGQNKKINHIKKYKAHMFFNKR